MAKSGDHRHSEMPTIVASMFIIASTPISPASRPRTSPPRRGSSSPQPPDWPRTAPARHALTHAALIARIDEGITSLHGFAHRLRRLVVVVHPRDTQSQPGKRCAPFSALVSFGIMVHFPRIVSPVLRNLRQIPNRIARFCSSRRKFPWRCG